MCVHNLVKKVDLDVVAAMKTRDAEKLLTLRMMKTAFKNKEIEKREPLTESEAQAVLATLIKQRRESIDQFTKGGRPELAEKEAAEIVIIEAYLPKAATPEELKALIDEVIAELTVSGERLTAKDMGLVMKAVQESMKEKGVRAEGRQVSELVKAELAK